MAIDNKIRMSFSIDSSTKDKLDKYKAAGVDLNLSSIVNDILQFNFKSVETFIDCMIRIHQPKENEFTRIYVQNGILILGEVEEAKKMDYLRAEKLDQPEIIRLLNSIKISKNEENTIENALEKELFEMKKRVQNLETLALMHNSEIKKQQQLIQSKLYKEELEELEKKYKIKNPTENDL